MLDPQTPDIKLLADLIDGNPCPMAQSEGMPEAKGLDGEERSILRQPLVASDP